MISRSAWFRYRPVKGGKFLPKLSVVLAVPGWVSGPVDFIVDSGASVSIAPMHYSSGWIDADAVKEVWTGCQDASGNDLMGFPAKVRLIINGFPEVEETIYFSSTCDFGLLGNRGFFESVAAYFHNFDKSPRGRKFGLALPKFSKGGGGA